ncbi:hypothetical protein QEN19_002913 [Hanseniaspora menglaensis]
MSENNIHHLYDLYLKEKQEYYQQDQEVKDEANCKITLKHESDSEHYYNESSEDDLLSDSSSIIKDIDLSDITENALISSKKKINILGLTVEEPKKSANDVYVTLIHVLNTEDLQYSLTDCLNLIEDNLKILNKSVLSTIIKESKMNSKDIFSKYCFNDTEESNLSSYISNYPYKVDNIIFQSNFTKEKNEAKVDTAKVSEEENDDDWGWDEDLDIDNIDLDDKSDPQTKLPIPFIELLKVYDLSEFQSEDDYLINLLFRNLGADNINALILVDIFLVKSNIKYKFADLVNLKIQAYLKRTIKDMLESLENDDLSNNEIMNTISNNINSALMIESLLEVKENIEYKKNYIILFINQLLKKLDTRYVDIPDEFRFLIKSHLLDCFKKLECNKERDIIVLLRNL